MMSSDPREEPADDVESPQERSPKEFYRRNLPHIQKSGRPIFVTFRTARGLVLPESVRERVLKHCLHDDGVKIHVHCVVVMPDHVHILLTLRGNPDGVPFSLKEITQAVKGVSSHTVNRLLKRKGCVWQDESFDHILRSGHTIEEKAMYICENPVRKGLVGSQDEYPWLWREWVEGADAQEGSGTE
ncbi:MAG: transposase [Candidatus Hydrogenedentes bacterium]|nr:transposase [Candidatus Hydrogenedentota bacterium]